ncbi:hypothetical protein Tco_1203899 [Tanacetum coccineum]
MCTYLKNIEGWKPKSLKSKSFANIQELFEKAMKRVNTFVDYRTELVEESSKKAETELEENLKKAKAEVMEGSSKRAGEELEQENEEEVAIDGVPLATKPPTIVDWKIHKEGKKSYYKIIRADGKSQMYRVFSLMLTSFSREDLEYLYKMVKAKYGSTRPVEDLDLILYGDLKTMFKPHVEDQVWKNQDDYNVLDWKLYDSYGVHSLRMQHVYIHMLVEKRYPLTPSTITDMLNKKLQIKTAKKVSTVRRKDKDCLEIKITYVISTQSNGFVDPQYPRIPRVCKMRIKPLSEDGKNGSNLSLEINNPDVTMEEYVQYKTEKALRNNQAYNWETAKYDKIWYIEDINYLRFFETKFPAIVYDDALSSQHVDKVNWKNETSLSGHEDEKYNVISKRKVLKKQFSKKEKFNILSIDEDLFSYDIFFVDDLKLDKDND